MKAKEYCVLLFTIGICGCAPWAAKRTEDKTPEKYVGLYPNEHRVGYSARDTLKGLTGVGVQVVIGGSGVREYGLTEQVLQNFVESQLRKHKINVFSGEIYPVVIGSPHLVVSVDSRIKKAGGPVLASISVTLQQQVWLDRNRNLNCYGHTWGTHLAATFEKGVLEDVYRMVEIMIERFSYDYLEANK